MYIKNMRIVVIHVNCIKWLVCKILLYTYEEIAIRC